MKVRQYFKEFFKGKSEAQQTSSLVHDLDLAELFDLIIVYCTERRLHLSDAATDRLAYT